MDLPLSRASGTDVRAQKPQDVKEADVVDSDKWGYLLALMVQATFFTQQNVSMTVLPPERKDNSTANPDDESLATTVLKPCQSPKPIVWVQPAETGAVLCPQDALLASFQYTDCRGRMLALTPTDVLRWTQAAKGLHDTCGNFNTFIRLLNSISSDLKENLSCGGEMSESLRRFQRVVTSGDHES